MLAASPAALARRGGGRSGAQRGGRDRAIRSAACCGRTIPGRSASCWSTTAAATAPPRPPCRRRRRATSGRAPRRLAGAAAAVGMDRQAVGAGAGRAARHGRRRAIDYFLLTDADIGHAPDNLSTLVARAEHEGRVLVSLMAELSCTSLVGAVPHSGLRLLLPDALSLRLGRAAAIAGRPPPPAAACWCRRDALERAGGIAAIRSEIIDDCALARRLKRQGPIWLGLTRRARSLRPYGGFVRDRPHGFALGLCPARLFAAACWRAPSPPWRWSYVAPPLLALFGRRAGAMARDWRLAGDGARLPAHAALLSPSRRSGGWRCPPSARPIRSSPCSRRSTSGAAAAACGRAASRPWRATHDGAADFARARVTGTRTSRWPRGWCGAELRPAILAFYRFARAADDVADNARPRAEEKLAQLDADGGRAARRSRRQPGRRCAACQSCRPAASRDRHALDLLEAFRRDVTKRRYADWAELMDYCRYSAAPVGRFVLDLHGESPALWPANDALCAALQVINHLQDCAKDYRALDRVYIPLDALAAQGLGVASLAGRTGLAGRCARRSPPGAANRARCSISRGPSPSASPIAGWRWKSASSRRWRRAWCIA